MRATGGMKNMISENLKTLRTLNQLTQEEVAEKINVSRQVIAKWEKGESVPDINACLALANLFNVTLDNLVSFKQEVEGISVPPKGKHFFGLVTVGERGQIVIPKKARETFNIKAGDSLILVGDEDRGLAIVPETYVNEFFHLIKTPLNDN